MQTGLSLYNEDWYKLLLDDLKAIVTESVFSSRIELIKGKWLFGQRIKQENSNFERAKIYGKEIVKKIATDLERNEKDIYRCIQFHDKYPKEDFDTVCQYLPEGKNISWHKLTNLYLVESSANEQEIDENIETCNKCPKCGYEW